jgi:hypothetical protein
VSAVDKLLNAADVADTLGYSLDHFRRSWRDWRRKHGFPAPLVGLKWDAAALENWRTERAAAMQAQPAKPGRPPREIDNDDRQRQAQRNVDRLASQNRQASHRP